MEYMEAIVELMWLILSWLSQKLGASAATVCKCVYVCVSAFLFVVVKTPSNV